jgi:hypothetical protein
MPFFFTGWSRSTFRPQSNSLAPQPHRSGIRATTRRVAPPWSSPLTVSPAPKSFPPPFLCHRALLILPWSCRGNRRSFRPHRRPSSLRHCYPRCEPPPSVAVAIPCDLGRHALPCRCVEVWGSVPARPSRQSGGHRLSSAKPQPTPHA